MAADSLALSILCGVLAFFSLAIAMLYFLRARRGDQPRWGGDQPRWYWYTRGLTWVVMSVGFVLLMRDNEKGGWVAGLAIAVQVVAAWIVRYSHVPSPEQPGANTR